MNVSNVLVIANKLATTRRYSNSRLIQDENLLEHVGFVSFFALTTARELNSVKPNSIDMAEVLEKAILHDLEECETGDTPRPTKYYSKEVRQAFEVVESAGVDKVLEDMQLLPETADFMKHTWVAAKDAKSGSVIKLADIAAVIYKMHSEVTLMGNLSMLHTCRSVPEYLRDIRTVLELVWDDNTDALKYLMSICDQLNELAVVATSRGNGVL
ncbi:putative HD domain protein [Vibrio phage 150E35-1]|nr:putative HD domain protein [Vibrio phage 150E35-1]